MKKLFLIVVLGLMWCNVGVADHCGHDFDRSWNWNDDKTWMEWSFKNKTDKAITILSTGLKTRDKKIMYEDKLKIYLKPYGVVEHYVDVSDLNTDISGSGFTRCRYGDIKSTTKKSKKSKNTNENPGLVLLVVFGIIAYIIKKYLDSKKSKTSSNISSSSLNIDTKKVDQNTFETLGKSTRSFFKNPSDRVQNIFLIIIIIVIFGLLMTYCSDGSDGPPRFFGEVR